MIVKDRLDSDIVTVGIDASTKSCGVAVFVNGNYYSSFTKTFDGTFTYEKLKEIIDFFNQFFDDLVPDIVIIEEPLAVRNGRVTRHLNLVGGAIFSSAYSYCQTVDFIHNRTVKKLMNIKTKQDSIDKALKLYNIACKTDDESDAIMLVEAYKCLTIGSSL